MIRVRWTDVPVRIGVSALRSAEQGRLGANNPGMAPIATVSSPNMENNMAVKVELLSKVMEYIETHPEKHRQDVWAIRAPCGTAYCFAGHVVVMTGWTEIIEPSGKGYECTKGMERHYISDVARMELGMEHGDCQLLFNYKNSVTDLRQIVDKLIANNQ